MAMPRCRCWEKCKFYCRKCALFLCDGCVKSYNCDHTKHELYSVERGMTELPLRGAEYLKKLRKVGNQMAIRKGNDLLKHQHQGMEGIEKELLDFFSEVDREIAALKQKCLATFWAQKVDPPDSISWANKHLRNIRITISQLKNNLKYQNFDMNQLQNLCINAFHTIESAKNALRTDFESERKSGSFEIRYYERKAPRIRDEVAIEFLSGVHKKFTTERLFPWLKHLPDLGSL